MLTIVKILKISCLSQENICTIFLLDKNRFYVSFSIFILQLIIEKRYIPATFPLSSSIIMFHLNRIISKDTKKTFRLIFYKREIY